MQTTSPESKFPNEYIGIIFIQIDQHLKLFKKYKGFPIFWNTVYMNKKEIKELRMKNNDGQNYIDKNEILWHTRSAVSREKIVFILQKCANHYIYKVQENGGHILNWV